MSMKLPWLVAAGLFIAPVFLGPAVFAQTDAPPVMRTPPATLEDKAAMFDAIIEERTLKIMSVLAINEAAKSNRVQAAIVAHYRALHARDDAIDAELGALPRGSAEWIAQHQAMFPGMSQPLHERFMATLARDLTPEQLEKLKDKMTYGKVPFTYSAYCSILPGLTAPEKATILEMLKTAREVAVDGGNSGEKTAIFEEYKNQINRQLAADGIDVAKAIQDWKDGHPSAKKTTPGVVTNVVPAAP